MKKESLRKETKKYRYTQNPTYKEKSKQQAKEREQRIRKERNDFFKLIFG